MIFQAREVVEEVVSVELSLDYLQDQEETANCNFELGIDVIGGALDSTGSGGSSANRQDIVPV